MNELTHTPLPWATDRGIYTDVIEIWGTKDDGTLNEHVADIEIPQLDAGEAGEAPGANTAHANAALIVLAVNNHKRLTEMLEAVVAALDDASSVVDKSDDEAYAYQAELESARALLKELDR